MSKVFDLHWRPVRLCSKASFRTTTDPPNGFASETQTSFEGKNIALRAKNESVCHHIGG